MTIATSTAVGIMIVMESVIIGVATTIATSITVGIMIVMESAIIGVATTIAKSTTNGAIMVTATMMTTAVLKQPSVTRNISKPARNGANA